MTEFGYRDIDFDPVSIHTPTKGVTDEEIYQPGLTNVSIHTPTKGVTHKPHPTPSRLDVSIHTPTKGVTG